MANFFYEYLFDITFHSEARKVAFKPYSLVEFRENCDYFENFIPLYEMVCNIHEKDLNTLRLLNKELVVTVRKYMFFGENQNKLSEREQIYELKFVPFYDKDTIPSYMRDTKKVNDKIENPKEQSEATIGSLMTHKVKFTLLLQLDLQMRTFIHNYVLGSEEKPVNPMTAAMLCIEQNPYIKDCIVDKPDNTGTYIDLIVPANELKKAIRSIQYNYGIYSKSLLLFFSNGTLYMLNKFATQHSLKKDEIDTINVKINESNTKLKMISTVNISEKGKKVIYIRDAHIHKEDYETVEQVLYGDKFVFSNFGSVINMGFGDNGKTTFKNPLHEVSKEKKMRSDVGTKMIVDYDMLNNPFNMNSFMWERSKGVPISFALPGINCKHFSPNINILVNMTTPEFKKLYSGRYNISSADFVYRNIGKQGVRFRTHCTVLLSLYNKTDGFDANYEPK